MPSPLRESAILIGTIAAFLVFAGLAWERFGRLPGSHKD